MEANKRRPAMPVAYGRALHKCMVEVGRQKFFSLFSFLFHLKICRLTEDTQIVCKWHFQSLL